MKKILILIICILVFSTSIFAYNNTLNGILGYIISPSAVPLNHRDVLLSSAYIFDTNNLMICLTTSPFPYWEFGFAHEFPFTSGAALTDTPFIFTTKYQFFRGAIQAGGGAIFEFLPSENGYTSLELYIALHSPSIFGKGVMDISFGKEFVFGQQITPEINIYIGTQIPLLENTLYLLADFSNTGHRSGAYLSYLSDQRGVFNIGILAKLNALTFYLITYDFLDQPFGLTISLGANLRIHL